MKFDRLKIIELYWITRARCECRIFPNYDDHRIDLYHRRSDLLTELKLICRPFETLPRDLHTTFTLLILVYDYLHYINIKFNYEIA